MRRWLSAAGKRTFPRLFHALQRLGVDVLPRHFYSEIPDIAKLRATTDWRRPYSMIGVNGADALAQLEYLQSVMTPEVRAQLDAEDVHAYACGRNGEAGYGRVEADVLYGVVRSRQPRRVVQIGAGVSTAVILAAAEHARYSPQLLAVDPFPTDYLKQLAASGAINLLARPVETLAWPALIALEPGDLFFVDSTHTLGPAGEVSRIVLEMLPRLESGVIVHFHDIYFPFDYPPDVLERALFFPHESSLLLAFLVANASFEILTSLSMLHHQRPGELAALIDSYRPRPMSDGLDAGLGHFPSAIYLRS